MPAGAISLLVVSDGPLGQLSVGLDLKIEHSHRDEIGPALEGVREGLDGRNGPRRQGSLEGDPRLGDRLHERDGLLGVDTPHVIFPSLAPLSQMNSLRSSLGVAEK